MKFDLNYYKNLITSEHKTRPKFTAWLQAALQLFIDIENCANSLPAAFDVDNAVGNQLDILGGYVGVSRTVGFQPSNGPELVTNGGMETGNPPTGWSAAFTPETFEQSGVQKHSGSYSAHIIDSTPSYGGFSQPLSIITGKTYKFSFWYYLVNGTLRVQPDTDAHIYTTTGSWIYGEFTRTCIGADPNIYFINNSGSVAAEFYIDDVSVQEIPSPTLDDNTYRTLILATIGKNMWDGTIDSLQSLWQRVFPGGKIFPQTNQDMSFTVLLSGAFSSIIIGLITHDYIVPRPQGVLMNLSYGSMPFFGFDRVDSFVSGWDLGKWI
jgi:hypothetical protein